MRDVSNLTLLFFPKGVCIFFPPIFSGLLPTTAHLPFAMALFTVGGSGEEKKKSGKYEILYIST